MDALEDGSFGHLQVVQVITEHIEKVVKVFFESHDPTEFADDMRQASTIFVDSMQLEQVNKVVDQLNGKMKDAISQDKNPFQNDEVLTRIETSTQFYLGGAEMNQAVELEEKQKAFKIFDEVEVEKSSEHRTEPKPEVKKDSKMVAR